MREKDLYSLPSIPCGNNIVFEIVFFNNHMDMANIRAPFSFTVPNTDENISYPNTMIC